MNANPKTEERTEYFHIYVTKDEKRQLEDMSDNKKLQLEIIKQMFTGEKNWLQQEMSQMDDELLKYRAMLLKCRETYSEARQVHEDKLNEFWESIYKNIPNFQDKIYTILKQLDPITAGIKQIEKQLEGVSKYRIEEMLKVVQIIENLRPEQLAMFNMLVENFRTPQTATFRNAG